MELHRYNMIVCMDSEMGIAKDGVIPWNIPHDLKFFKEITTGGGQNNAVIMGRKTYESLPAAHKPLPNRHNIVISRTYKQADHRNIYVVSSVMDALKLHIANCEKRYVIGGLEIYKACIAQFMYLCNSLIVTIIPKNYQCDKFFPFSIFDKCSRETIPNTPNDVARYKILTRFEHPENAYIRLVQKILHRGEEKPDRTGVGTLSIFPAELTFNISYEIPILTCKKTNYDSIIKELLFFISGKTDTKLLEEQGVKIWQGNTSKEFIEKRGLKYREGDAGPIYGFQWRHWGAKYEGCDADYTEKGIDQLANVIKNIQEDPFSRRHIVSAWNVEDLGKMVLPPCHMEFQFNVSGDGKYLDCKFIQRSADVGLGVPFNIASYAILTYMVAHLCKLTPRTLTASFGDAHIYKNHISAMQEVICRTPKPWARLRFVNTENVIFIDDFQREHIEIIGYDSWDYVKLEMAI